MYPKEIVKTVTLSVIVKLDEITTGKDEAKKFINQLNYPNREQVEHEMTLVLMKSMGCKLWKPWFSYCKVHEEDKFDKSTGVCEYAKALSVDIVQNFQLKESK